MGNSQSSDAPDRSPSAASQHGRRDGSIKKSSGSVRKPSQKSSTPASLVPAPSAASPSTSNAHAHAETPSSAAASPKSPARHRALTTGTNTPAHKTHTEQSDVRYQTPPRATTLPIRTSTPNDNQQSDELDEALLLEERSYGLPPGEYSRPPRLPLPIETEHEPGSPFPSPRDGDMPPLEYDHHLHRRGSMLSSTTLDDDEDAAEIQAFDIETHPAQPKVPTTLEWRGNGRQVYVTGTFVQWERKFRLHKNGDTFSATIPLSAGTHHLKFLVDDSMVTSEDLPTTVDFTNALVNYIEVVAPLPGAQQQPQVASQAVAIPGAALTAGQAVEKSDGTAGPGPPSQHLTTERPSVPRQPSDQSTQEQQQQQQQQQQRPVKQMLPRATYTNEIPDVLLHMDLYNAPEDERYQRAQKAVRYLPQPPSLPSFMQKSILNAVTPHKDDASVLAMPNHTVLNHLATSSIRNGVLATSGTTRYKRKFLTTIMYKPTSEQG